MRPFQVQKKEQKKRPQFRNQTQVLSLDILLLFYLLLVLLHFRAPRCEHFRVVNEAQNWHFSACKTLPIFRAQQQPLPLFPFNANNS